MKNNMVLRFLAFTILATGFIGCVTASSNPEADAGQSKHKVGEAQVAATSKAAVGVWDVIINTPVGKQPSVWTILENGTGSLKSSHGEHPFENVILSGNNVEFKFSTQGPGGRAGVMTFKGVAEGSALTGTLRPEYGDVGLKVEGTKR